MEIASLDNLILTREELEIAHHQVQEIAYLKWEAAGCPTGQDNQFWNEAELEWIEYFYVPDRYVCEGCSKTVEQPHKKLELS